MDQRSRDKKMGVLSCQKGGTHTEDRGIAD